MASEPNAANRAKARGRGRQAGRENEIKKLGKYAIKKKIGAGGMGAVFLAVDTDLKRTVALKVLPKEKAENPVLVKRFKSEAQAAAHLKHENIVTVYEASEADGFLFIALEYVEGVDVHNLVNKRGVLPVKRSINIIKQLAKALQHAHEQSIAHRDIKPANILIQRDGVVKLTDMGLARSIDESSETGITRAGTTVGTVDFMAPEQARSSKAADTRSDIYSLGCTWYHMLTGSPPFPEGSLMNKLNAHATKPPPDPRDVNDTVSETVIAIMHRMMAKAPDDRYQTPDELLEDLENTNLKRTDVTSTDLAHLAESSDDDTDDDTDQFPAAPTQTSGPRVPPPRKDQKAKDKEDEEESKTRLSLQPVKIVAIIAVAILVVVGIGLGMQKFGNVIDDGSENYGSGNPFNRKELDDAYAQTNGDEKSQDPDQDSGDQSNSGRKKNSSDDPGSQSKAYQSTNQTIKSGASSIVKKTPVAENAPKFGSRLILPSLASMGRPGERQYFTDWVDEVSKPVAEEFPTITVGFEKKDSYRFDSLDSALRRMPESGAIIEIDSDGPFFVKPVKLRACESIVIRAVNNSRPVIVLVPDDNKPSDRLIDIVKGSLTLDGVHLHVRAESITNSRPITIVSVDSGHLAAINSTVTLRGTRRGFTTAFALSGSVYDSEERALKRSRVLFHNVMVRGNGLTAFSLDQTAIDLLASNCIFATGAAPAMTLMNRQKISNSDRIKLQPSRKLTFASTAIHGIGTAFEFHPGIEAANPPDTDIVAVNSVMSGRGRSSMLLELSGWPKSASTSTDNMFQGLHWTTHSSLYCGWDRLIEVAVGGSLTIRDEDGWRRVWGAGADDAYVQSDFWPRDEVVDFGKLSPQALDPLSLNVSLLTTTDGSEPGCMIDSLRLPFSLTSRRAETFSRHGHPREIKSAEFTNKNTIEVDLSKKDLGKVLSDTSWEDGTLVIAYGSGTHEMSPVIVKGKSLRIEFLSTDAPLMLVARVRAKAGGSSDDEESLFTVTNGTLELLNGNLRIPDRSGAPNCFLMVNGGSFSIQNCTIVGPVRSTGQFESLVDWRNGTDETPADNNAKEYGAIINSYLVSSGKLLKADIRKRAFYLRNSLLVSLDELFQLRIPGIESEISGAIDIQNCTLSAASAFFNINSSTSAKKATDPLTLFVSETVFAPAVDPGVKPAPTQAIMTCKESVQSNQQIDWWGESNGYSVVIRHYLRRPGDAFDSPAQTIKERLTAMWKPSQLSRPLSGHDGVLLKHELPDRTELKSEDFVLHSSSSAYGWGRNKMPIGFDPSEWKSNLKKNVEGATTQEPGETTGNKKKKTPTKTPKVNF